MWNEVLEAVKALGLSEYEAKAYLALLDESPASGYRVALNSGVPRSKVYEALGGLVDRGVALVNHGEPVRYAPVSPEEMISRRKRELEGTLESAQGTLDRYVGSADSRGAIWDLTGREAILQRAREMAGRAEQSLLLEVWQEDAPELREALSEAAERGIEVSVIAYGDPGYPFARVYHHDLVDEVTRGLGARWLVLSLDLREVVTGMLSMGDQSRAAWTSHPGLVVPTTELIKHDIYVQEMLDAHRDTLEASFGPSLEVLRGRFERIGEIFGHGIGKADSK
ncbi:TrmB family transcriptional regulator [soil metagenome]